MLFSHPCNHTPVCTTEIASFADNADEFRKRNVKLVGLSVNSINEHTKWLSIIQQAKVTSNEINFPIVADHDGEVAQKYGM